MMEHIGGPIHLAAAEVLDHRLAARCTATLHARVQREADRRGMSPSDFLRGLVEQCLDQLAEPAAKGGQR